MKVQKFEADSMPQALQKVKAALGADAVIMDTRRVRKPGLLGVGAHECVQVWAAHPLPNGLVPSLEIRRQAPDAAVESGAMPRLDTGLLTALHARLGDLEAKLDMLAMAASYRGDRWGGGDEAARMSDDERAAALAALARRILVSGEICLGETRTVALVGPTGAGKTLTAAKLAGRFALTHGARVGVICADGFRPGAAQELKTYCDLLGVPMAHAREAGEMPAAFEGLADCELILIDTAGASQRNDRHLAELRELLAAAGADEAHLVLSAACSHASCAQALQKFVRIGATHLVFTKLDESPQPAEALTAAVGCGRPISYVADGQAVPDDLRAADEAYLTSVLTQEPACAAALISRSG